MADAIMTASQRRNTAPNDANGSSHGRHGSTRSEGPHSPQATREAQIPSAPSPAPSHLPQKALPVLEGLEGHDDAPRPAPGRATFLRSFVYAWQGLTYAFRTQRNARVHMAMAVVALAVGVALHVTPVGMAIVLVAITFVFITEMLNTVAEAIVDMVTQEYHPLARTAKDVAAGAVLLSAMLAVVIGLLVFGPPLVTMAAHLVQG